jgi:hypothetical protein
MNGGKVFETRVGRTAVFILMLVLLLGCTKGLVDTQVGAEGGSRKILIAAYPTEYKNKIAQGLASFYKDRAVVTLVTMQDLKSIDYRQYDAFVLIDQLMAWQMFNFESKWFINSLKEPEVRRRLVLYLTAGSPKQNYKFHGVDAMTGATMMNREAEAIETIFARIDAVLANP